MRATRERWLVVVMIVTLVVAPGCSRSARAPQATESTSSAGDDGVDLSPAAWPDGRLAEALSMNGSFGDHNDLAVGAGAIITGTTGEPALVAGLEAMRQGGGAVDAALTASLAQICLAAGA